MFDTVWKSVLGELQLELSDPAYQLYIKDTKLTEYSDNKIIISAKNPIICSTIEKKYLSTIQAILKKLGYSYENITLAVEKSSTAVRNISRERLVEDTQPKKISYLNTKTSQDQSHLNPKYTFDSFIVGSNNDFAFNAAQAIAREPGARYNPFFVYGGVGLGKTHLLQAIGNEIIKNDETQKVIYISSETFLNEFLSHLRQKKNKSFGQKYRNADVLIIDDMQFMTGKEATQEEFFHTFNALHQQNKQIIIGSDRLPKAIATLTDRLRSRFEMGVMADVQLPNFETRCAIIQSKAEESGYNLSSETVHYIAENIHSNVREIEGILNKLIAYASMRNIPPDIQLAEGVLSDNIASKSRHVSPKQVIEKTARHFGIDVKDIRGNKRTKHIVIPRQVAMYIIREELKLSLPAIASELNRKDHTTVMHALKKIQREMKLDTILREHINDILEKIYA